MKRDKTPNQSSFLTTSTEWLANEDAKCFDARVARISWMAEKINSDQWHLERGGLLGTSLFEEMRYCFAYGQFIAANALGMAYIERTFAAYFYGIGRNDLERASMAELLDEACKHGLINSVQFEELDRIRRSRNAYSHFRPPLHREAVEVRAIEEEESFYGIIEQDATLIVEAAFWLYAQRL